MSTARSESAEHERPGEQGPDPPLEVDAELLVHLFGHDAAEEAVDGELHGEVGDEGDEGAADARHDTEATAHVGEERAGVGDPVAHGCITDAEQQQRDADSDVCPWHPGAVAHDDRDGDRTGHADERRGRSDDEEDDPDDAEAALAEGRPLGLLGCGLQLRHEYSR